MIPLAIALGSETDGLTAAWEAPDIENVRLPMHGVADSLNVSATAALSSQKALRVSSSMRAPTCRPGR